MWDGGGDLKFYQFIKIITLGYLYKLQIKRNYFFIKTDLRVKNPQKRNKLAIIPLEKELSAKASESK